MSGKRIAVLGGGVGGLVAAGTLARDGNRVTLFEGSQVLGGKARALWANGHTLDVGPTVLTMPRVVRETFAALEATDLLPELLPVPLQCHYQWPTGKRLDLHQDLERTVAGAEAFGAGEGERLRRLYADAASIYEALGRPYLESPYEGPLRLLQRAWRTPGVTRLAGSTLQTLDGFARARLSSPELVQLIGRFATYVGASPFEASATFAMIAHLERAEGVFHPRGGLAALAGALATAARRLGVTVHLGTRARVERRGSELLAGPDGGLEVFDAVVVNGDPLAHQGRTSGTLSLSGYVLLLEADRRLDLPHHSILFSSDSRAEFAALFSGEQPEGATLCICHPASTDASMSPDGKSGLFLMFNAPPLRDGDEARWPERAAALRTEALERLRAAFPSARDAKLTVLGERTPLDLLALGAPRGSIYGFVPHGRLGPFQRPPMRSRTRGVVFAGGGTHPGGGVPLVMLSGRFAAQELARA